MSVPDWISDSIFYQIFPDRFENGDKDNDPTNVQPWGAKPTIRGFQGGDLRGVINRFDYLQDLGINSIYLNPIFQATSNHRYNTTDYYQIDPILGSFRDYEKLIEIAHQNDMRVILDGVFNHSGRGFFAFQDLLENQQHSNYVDWYHVHQFPLDAYGSGKAENYAAWWSFKSLPKFNTSNPEVRRYLLDVARFWIERGADGWRLDVPNEIDDDDFWQEFRDVVKSVNSQAYLVGEIWEADPRWVGDHHFDGLMNYPFREALVDFFIKDTLSPSQFGAKLEWLINIYPQENAFAHLLPMGSHDTPRLKTVAEGDMKKVRLMSMTQFHFPGIPSVYYGDEIGLEGDKDPDCRRAFSWNEESWDQELRGFLKTLISLRNRYSQLRYGKFERIFEDDDRGIVVFSRVLDGNQAILAMNVSSRAADVQLKHSKVLSEGVFEDVTGSIQITHSDRSIDFELASWEGAIFVNRHHR
jgi:glycosidase